MTSATKQNLKTVKDKRWEKGGFMLPSLFGIALRIHGQIEHCRIQELPQDGTFSSQIWKLLAEYWTLHLMSKAGLINSPLKELILHSLCESPANRLLIKTLSCSSQREFWHRWQLLFNSGSLFATDWWKQRIRNFILQKVSKISVVCFPSITLMETCLWLQSQPAKWCLHWGNHCSFLLQMNLLFLHKLICIFGCCCG